MTRQTMQKTIVAQALSDLANHPTAEAVYEQVHADYPNISKATVYRILNGMVEEGTALRARINNGADHFDHQTFPHQHVRCVCCGSVDDVVIPVLDGINETAGQVSGYHVLEHTIQFDGVCPACQQAS